VNLHSDHKKIKEIILSVLAGMSLLLLTACQNQSREAGGTKIQNQVPPFTQNKDIEIIIYGSKSCPHCVAFIDKMDQEKISYTFKEVDHDDKNYQEMLDKIKSINFAGYVSYPVIDVGGSILVAPDFDQFIEIYRRN
jgi:glutaredoxin